MYINKKYTPGICDRCGFAFPLSKLCSEVVRGKTVGNSVCKGPGTNDCWDADHPQLWVGSRPVSDKQSVPDASPEPLLRESRSLFGFDPVGAQGNSLRLSGGVISII